jgi:N-acetylglucosaminyl-diphospho-decaprenol L-rhamnosyltransferase
LSAPPTLTVAIVSFNTRRLLEACLATLLDSLAASPEVGARVVVVDNASSDGSAAMVRERFPGVELRALAENLGFSGGNNLVLREAQTPYVLLLNPDTEVRADAPAALVRFLEAHPRAGAAGARLVYPDGSFQHSAFRFPTLPMSFLDFFPLNHRLTDSRLNGRYPRAWYDRAFEIDHPLGACLMVRRAALEQVGLMDEGYFMYAEEVDLCWRIRRAGWQIWYTPEATVVHHQGAATRQFRGEMLVQLHRSRYRFFARHYPAWFGPAARAVVALGVLRDLARAAGERLGGRIDAAEWRQRRDVYGRLLAL